MTNKRNPIAKSLRSPHLRQRVVPGKRQSHDDVWKHLVEELNAMSSIEEG